MSRTIDMEDPGSWTEDDRLYLQHRGMLPADEANVLETGMHPDDAPLPPNTGTVNTVPAADNSHELKLGESFLKYQDMTVDELRKELRDRKLTITGQKGELVFRLLSDDKSKAEDEDDSSEDDEDFDEEDEA